MSHRSSTAAMSAEWSHNFVGCAPNRVKWVKLEVRGTGLSCQQTRPTVRNLVAKWTSFPP